MALINLRNALMTGKRLPYDAEVEYLESTGMQYINTGVLASAALNDAQIDITYSSSDNTGDLYVFGGGNTYGSAIQMALTTRTNYAAVSWGQNISIQGAYQKDAVTTARMTYNDYSIAFGSTTKTGSFTAASRTFSERNIYLFRLNRSSGGINSNKSVRIYAYKISRNGVAIQDFIPVRKGTVGYLYDRVSGKLFGNAGTGDFVLGPDVVPVEYLQSSGTQYIDTGTLIEMTDKVDCTFELLAYGNVTLAGARVNSSNYSLAIWAYTNTEQRIRFDLISDNHGDLATSITPTLGREYKVSKIGIRNFVDGVEVQSNTSVAYTPVRPCYLFAMNNGGTASFIGNCRIKGFSIGSKLKYRPVRVGTDATSWEGAMMDVLTRRIYRNAGTGAFTYGNDLKYPIPAE